MVRYFGPLGKSMQNTCPQPPKGAREVIILLRKGPSTQYFRTLAPATIPSMVLGTRVLKSWVLGPSGLHTCGRLELLLPQQVSLHYEASEPLAKAARPYKLKYAFRMIYAGVPSFCRSARKLRVAQKALYNIWSLGPKSLKHESLEA